MFRVFVLFSSPRSRRPPAWRRASGSYVMGGQAEGQGLGGEGAHGLAFVLSGLLEEAGQVVGEVDG